VAARLEAHGLSAGTPVGIVVNAGRRDRQTYRGTLGDLVAGAVEFADGPAVILLGEAVAAGDWESAAALAEVQIRVA
jgi:uroporphyrin-III C-methyltransferase/precorrin-2 dehydrogenase/sirohydrochlorin ferrochelatase